MCYIEGVDFNDNGYPTSLKITDNTETCNIASSIWKQSEIVFQDGEPVGMTSPNGILHFYSKEDMGLVKSPDESTEMEILDIEDELFLLPTEKSKYN
jgi:hypothetical protein